MPTEAKLSGKTYQVINSLASTLTYATLKSSPAEKAAIAKEFARVFEILSKRLAVVYAKAPEKLKQDLEKASDKAINEIIPSSAICCVGYPGAKSLEDCEGHGGTWACFAKPIEET